MRGKQVLLTAVLALAAMVVGALFALRRRGVEVVETRTAAAKPQAASDVILPATIRSQSTVPVGVPVQGTVESLLVETGQPVYEGQLIARIKNTALEADRQSAAAELERAETRLSQLESQLIVARADAARARSEASRVQGEFDRTDRAYQRQQMLLKEGATPRLAYEKAAKEYEAARADRDTADGLARGAEDRLALLVRNVDAARQSAEQDTQSLEQRNQAAAAAEIRSPVSGLVTARSRQVGEEVTPDVQDLFQIAVDLSLLEAVLEADPASLSRIRTGQEALLTMAETPDPIPAQVAEIKGSQVILRFQSPSAAVRPGLTAQARILLR
jgi:multidrug resistance efflux pump